MTKTKIPQSESYLNYFFFPFYLFNIILALSGGLHSTGRVDRVAEQTVSRHFQADHSGADWTWSQMKRDSINCIYLFFLLYLIQYESLLKLHEVELQSLFQRLNVVKEI